MSYSEAIRDYSRSINKRKINAYKTGEYVPPELRKRVNEITLQDLNNLLNGAYDLFTNEDIQAIDKLFRFSGLKHKPSLHFSLLVPHNIEFNEATMFGFPYHNITFDEMRPVDDAFTVFIFRFKNDIIKNAPILSIKNEYEELLQFAEEAIGQFVFENNNTPQILINIFDIPEKIHDKYYNKRDIYRAYKGISHHVPKKVSRVPYLKEEITKFLVGDEAVMDDYDNKRCRRDNTGGKTKKGKRKQLTKRRKTTKKRTYKKRTKK